MAPSPANLPSQLNSICGIPSLEIPCPCLLGEDNKPHTESLTSRWEFVHHMTPSGSGAGGSRSSSIHNAAQTPSRTMRAGADSPVFSPWSSQWVFLFVLIEVQVVYNVVLVSGVQQSDSVIHIFFFTFFSLISYYKILSRVPCAIQQVLLVIYFIYVVCIY